MFDEKNQTWGGRELAQKMKVNHSNLYRVLETLEKNDFIRKDQETKRYSLGPAVWELGMQYYKQLNVEKVLRPLLNDMRDRTGESAFFTVLKRQEGLTLMVSEPENKVKFSVSEGSTAPLYVGASYRAILAFLSEEEQDIIISRGLKQYTENTLTDPGELKNELIRIKKQKWAESQGEYTPDINAVAVPVFIKNEVIGSLTISGPMYRFKEQEILEALTILNETSVQVSELIKKYDIKI